MSKSEILNQSDLDKNQASYVVEKILDKKISKGKSLYKVRWKGYGPEWDSWEPKESFHTRKILSDFEATFGKKKEKVVVECFQQLERYGVQNGKIVEEILGINQDDRFGLIALVVYKSDEVGIENLVELVPTSVLKEFSSDSLLNYYENNLNFC